MCIHSVSRTKRSEVYGVACACTNIRTNHKTRIKMVLYCHSAWKNTQLDQFLYWTPYGSARIDIGSRTKIRELLVRFCLDLDILLDGNVFNFTDETQHVMRRLVDPSNTSRLSGRAGSKSTHASCFVLVLLCLRVARNGWTFNWLASLGESKSKS